MMQDNDPAGFLASIAIAGSGGMGAVTVGSILLDAIAACGLYGVMTRSYGPQIRGGESAVVIRFGDRPVQSQADCIDVLFCLSWDNVERFVDEIPLTTHSVLVGPEPFSGIPGVYARSGATVTLLDFTAELEGIEGARGNMLVAGIAAAWMGIESSLLCRVVEKHLASKSPDAVAASCACARKGYESSSRLMTPCRSMGVAHESIEGSARWSVTGNQACAFGALLGGVRFVAAYPITPATDLLDWLALRLPQIGGALVQAEDELASINMIIGASYGGVPALTATSGPGLSLMLESVGLAVASEIPLLIINVSRGGPSTGIPTKPEQSDFNIAVYGLHGDAPHLVAAPMGVRDCLYTAQRMVALVEHLQVPGIILSDQLIAQAQVIMDAPTVVQSPPSRLRAVESDLPYQRYSLLSAEAQETGVSPMSIPGDANLQYTADGLEHNAHGTPSSGASDHAEQSTKRRLKLEHHEFGEFWGQCEGEGDLALISWGSSCDAMQEAADVLRDQGVAVRSICLRQLSPLPRAALLKSLAGATTALVVELNGSGQLYHYLESHAVMPEFRDTLCRPGPLVFRPAEIVDAAMKISAMTIEELERAC